MNDTGKAIIYVPGMKPKPPAEIHRANLLRCLLEGLQRHDVQTARQLAEHEASFRLVPWPRIFYAEEKDPAPDQPGLERLLQLPGPESRDIEEAGHWHKQVARLAYLLCDTFPFLVDWVANPNVRATLQDSLRYLDNENGIASRIQEMLASELDDAAREQRAILVIAHSLGSVIAWDVLWILSRQHRADLRVDLLTLGSPLGLNFMRHRLHGAHARGAERYPDNIRHWRNLSAIGEMTALDRRFANDYREMLRRGLVESITDETDLFNYFRGPDGLNVHKCYGYMINPRTAAAVSRWWRGG